MFKIAKYPETILRKKAKPISDFSAELKKIAQDMAAVMYADDGIGLAAPQVSLSIRLIVVGSRDRQSYQAYVNPEITYFSKDEKVTDEGCLSLPGIFGLVSRPKKIHIKYQDLDGRSYKDKVKDMTAIILQHEIDHLDGVLFIDRAEKITEGQDILDNLKNAPRK